MDESMQLTKGNNQSNRKNIRVHDTYTRYIVHTIKTSSKGPLPVKYPTCSGLKFFPSALKSTNLDQKESCTEGMKTTSRPF